MKLIRRNESIERKDLNLNESMKKFLDYIDVSDKTVETYNIALNQFANYMSKKNIIDPTREDIIEWREELRETLKPTTVNSYLIAVRNFYKYLEYSGIHKNITENVKGIKLEQRHLKLGLSEEELKKVIDVCETHKEILMVKMMVNLGLRANELVNIRLEDFYRDGNVILLKVLGKARDGLKQDSIKIDERLYETIKIYVQQHHVEDYLFTSDSKRNYNQPITTKTVRLTIKNLFKKANLDNIDLKSSHSLRHTTTTMLLENDVSIQEVSQFMRHKNINTTMVYAKELNQKESKCSNILADNLF